MTDTTEGNKSELSVLDGRLPNGWGEGLIPAAASDTDEAVDGYGMDAKLYIPTGFEWDEITSLLKRLGTTCHHIRCI